jgi:hypothetical protein
VVQVAGISQNDLLEFSSCTFTDEDYLGTPVYPQGGTLLNLGAPPDPYDYYYKFVYCTFNLHHNRAISTAADPLPEDADLDLRIFDHCDFNFYYNDIVSDNFITQPQPLAVFRDCQLYKNNFIDMNPSTVPPHDFYSIIAEMPNDPSWCAFYLCQTDGSNLIVPGGPAQWSHIPRNYCPSCCYYMTWANF